MRGKTPARLPETAILRAEHAAEGRPPHPAPPCRRTGPSLHAPASFRPRPCPRRPPAFPPPSGISPCPLSARRSSAPAPAVPPAAGKGLPQKTPHAPAPGLWRATPPSRRAGKGPEGTPDGRYLDLPMENGDSDRRTAEPHRSPPKGPRAGPWSPSGTKKMHEVMA